MSLQDVGDHDSQQLCIPHDLYIVMHLYNFINSHETQSNALLHHQHSCVFCFDEAGPGLISQKHGVSCLTEDLTLPLQIGLSIY